MAADRDQVLETIQSYVDLVGKGTADDILALYAEGATVEDPSITMLPLSWVPPPVVPPLLSSVPPHAAATRAVASVRPSSHPRPAVLRVIPKPPGIWGLLDGRTVGAVADAAGDGR